MYILDRWAFLCLLLSMGWVRRALLEAWCPVGWNWHQLTLTLDRAPALSARLARFLVPGSSDSLCLSPSSKLSLLQKRGFSTSLHPSSVLLLFVLMDTRMAGILKPQY